MSPKPRADGLSDAPARRRAVTLFGKNLVVTAGAGTGKTALLVERALNLIGCGAAGIEDLAVITFTEKAAAELRERLAAGLDRLFDLARRPPGDGLDTRRDADRSFAWLRGDAGVDPAQIARRALAALIGLDTASVSTIHAFCAEILRRHPRDAGVDPGFQIDDGPAFDRLFEREWQRHLAEELGPDGRHPDVWRRALRVEGALGSVRALARDLADFTLPGEAVAPGGGPAAPPPGRLLEAEIRAARDGARDILARVTGLPRTMAQFLPSAIGLLDAWLAGGAAEMAGADVPFRLDEFIDRDVPAPGKKSTGASAEEIESAARRAHDLVRALARIDAEAVGALLGAAAPLARRCRDELLRAGYVSFDALLRLARDLLAGHPEIRRVLAARHRAILVDEFQDTDPLQYEILFFITEQEGPPAADAYAADLAAGRLFIVGDPKQSIYRFRGADIEAYHRAVGRLRACGAQQLALTTSFRSPTGIVAPVNALFRDWIGRSEPGGGVTEPAYEPIESARGSSIGGPPRVEIWTVGEGGAAAGRRGAEGEAIAAWIAAHLGRPEATGTPLVRRHVAILLRALTNAGLYAQALRRAGIPFIVEGGKGFYERPEVADLIAFLRAAADPHDAASMLAVLRSPLGATPDTELARFAAAGGRLDLPGGAIAGLERFPNLARTFALVAEFRSAIPGRAPDEILRRALRATPLAMLHAAAFEGAQRLANLQKLVSRAEGLARLGLSLEETLFAIEAEFAGARGEGESPLADESVDAVRILSVHKAKGLEFPVVVVPDLGRESRPGRADGARCAWLGLEEGGALAVRLADGTTNAAWVRHADAARRHDVAEEKRVFYVACTRAQELLLLVNSSLTRSAPWRDALAALGYLVDGAPPPDGPLASGMVLHRRVEPSPRPVALDAPTDVSAWRAAAARFEAVADAAQRSTLPPVRWPAGAADERAADAGAAEELERRDLLPLAAPRSRDAARLAGSAVHAALERWDFKDAGRLRDLARGASRAVAQPWPDDLLRDTGGAADVEAETARIVEAFLATGLPARLASLEVLGREVPVLFRDDGGTTWVGSCDLVYRDRDGRIVAADYKTDRIDGDPAEAAETYRDQLAVYVEALRRALPGAAVRGEILFLRRGAVVPLGPIPFTPTS